MYAKWTVYMLVVAQVKTSCFPQKRKKRIFEIAKDEAKDDITLIAQVGSINLKESVELAKFVTDLGYDAISAVTPFLL